VQESQKALEVEANIRNAMSKDGQEDIHTFLDKRQPKFKEPLINPLIFIHLEYSLDDRQTINSCTQSDFEYTDWSGRGQPYINYLINPII